MHRLRARAGRWRGLFAGLVGLALAIQILLPPGFMAASSRAAPLSVVICTGHGPLLHSQDLGNLKTPPAKGKANTACTLAAHAGGQAPLAPSAVDVAWAWTPVAAPVHKPAAFAGRSRTTPPPARAPPAA